MTVHVKITPERASIRFWKVCPRRLLTIAFVLANWFSIVIVIVSSYVYGNVTYCEVVTYGYRFHDPSELLLL